MADNTTSTPKKQQTTAIAAVIIVVLLALCTFLIVRNYNLSSSKEEIAAKYDESEQLKADLDTQYYEALSELEGMRGSNEELNALIEQQKNDLAEQKEKIDKLIGNKRNLGKARKELKNLKGKVDQYIAEINQLRAENDLLTDENSSLSEQNTNLNSDLQSERMTSADLSSQRAILVSEKDELSNEKDRLSRKVNLASVIKTENIEVDGLKVRSSGKAVTKNYAKNIEQLRVCFNTTNNEVAEKGSETYHIRIINPAGETIAVDALGSGAFSNSATGSQLRFTMAKEFNYNQKEEQLCAVWVPQNGFSKGNYEVEIYNKGYLAGNKSFRLK